MIETERLQLRSMIEEDVVHMLRVFTDPNVMESFALESYSRSQMEEWVSENLAHQTEHGYGLFAVILKSNGAFIGNCGLEHTTFDGRPVVEIGYDLHSDYWNQGYATEAATAASGQHTGRVDDCFRVCLVWVSSCRNVSQCPREVTTMSGAQCTQSFG